MPSQTKRETEEKVMEKTGKKFRKLNAFYSGAHYSITDSLAQLLFDLFIEDLFIEFLS